MKTLPVLAISLSTCLFLGACEPTASPENVRTTNYPIANDIQDVQHLSRSQAQTCGNWIPMVTLPYANETDTDLFVCIGRTSPTQYLYKGVVARDLTTLKESPYYKSKGVDTTGVHVHPNTLTDNDLIYQNGQYLITLPYDAVGQFQGQYAQKQIDGELALMQDIRNHTWTQDKNHPNIYTNERNEVLYLGVRFPNRETMEQSVYTTSNTQDTSTIKIPTAYKNGEDYLAYGLNRDNPIQNVYYYEPHAQDDPTYQPSIKDAIPAQTNTTLAHGIEGSTSGVMTYITGMPEGISRTNNPYH